ncbi:hypothetical protein [Haloarcula onubensis]|nr:hypothetical protein [Halomicroarcula sp. S3CR25-11]
MLELNTTVDGIETMLFDVIHRGDRLSGFVVRTPIVYRDAAEVIQ